MAVCTNTYESDRNPYACEGMTVCPLDHEDICSLSYAWVFAQVSTRVSTAPLILYPSINTPQREFSR